MTLTNFSANKKNNVLKLLKKWINQIKINNYKNWFNG